MPKKKRTRKLKPKPKSKRQPTISSSSIIAKIGGLGWKSVVASTTIISLFSLFFYLNAISVSPSQFSIDPNNPFTNVFTLKNNFLTPIYDVYPECLINLTVNGKLRLRNTIGSEIDPIQRLGAFEKFDTQCPKGFPLNVEDYLAPMHLHICMRTLYTPFGIPKVIEQYFAFLMIKNSEQRVDWSIQPASDCESRFAPI